MKIYEGIGGNLFAYACKTSYEEGFDGVVSFYSKTQLIDHYSVTLGAILFANNKMIIPEQNAHLLVCKYFAHEKNEIHPELLNIDRMKSKPFTKKDFEEISAFIKASKEKKAQK